MKILKLIRMVFKKKKKCTTRTGELIAREKARYKKEAKEATNALLQAFEKKQVA